MVKLVDFACLVRAKPPYFLQRFLADIVYGATDGIVTSFVVVSGVEGAKLAPITVVILGTVNLFADGLSMGASSFLSRRAKAAIKNQTGFKDPFYHGLTTFFAFLIFGSIPLIGFFLPGFTSHRFLISSLMTGASLIIVGLLRAVIAKERWYQGMLEMFVIGGLAASIAYFLGHLLAQWVL